MVSMTLYALGEERPRIHPEAYIHPLAVLIGEIHIGPSSTVWPGAIIRADNGPIIIGARTSIQDGAVIHIGGPRGTVIGDYCTIAHRAVVHGAEIGDDCLIGIGAVVMDGAKLGRRCVVGAMALVPPGTEVAEGSVIMGVPGKVVATRDNFAATRRNALVYHRNALAYAQGRHDAWRAEGFAQWREEINRRLAAGEVVEA